MLFAKLTAHNNNTYKAAVFNTETLKYQFITLDQCSFREHAEAALKRQVPGVHIASDEAMFVQWLAELTQESEVE